MKVTMASSAEVSTQFNAFVFIDDALLQLLELKTGDAECSLKFSVARILKAPGGSPYDPRLMFEPGRLSFRGVRSIGFGGSIS